MREHFIWFIFLLSAYPAFSIVSLRICDSDGNTAIDCNSPVMVGSNLTIYIDSNSISTLWLGGIDINMPAQNPSSPYGQLFGRGWDSEAMDFADSHLASAGNRASTTCWQNQDQQSFEFRAAGSDVTPGPWFVVDYNVTSVGDCNLKLVEYRDSSIAMLHSQVLHQVATRDFNHDGNIDFQDFAKFASYWMHTDCNQLNDCGGTDINPIPDGKIDSLDLMYFAQFWLGQFRNNNPLDNTNGEPEANNENEIISPNLLPPIYLTCDTNTPDPNQEVTIYVHTTVPLLSLGLGMQIEGQADITSAMCEADCNSYGWDNGWSSDPYIDNENGYVFIGGIRWAADAIDTIGYFKLQYHNGLVHITINQENSSAFTLDDETGSSDVPFSTDILTIGSDPNQL
jgi:hypothetical protein